MVPEGVLGRTKVAWRAAVCYVLVSTQAGSGDAFRAIPRTCVRALPPRAAPENQPAECPLPE